MRDCLKDEKYFVDFIAEETARVNRFNEKLTKGEIKEERIIPVKTKIHDLKLGILIAKYSKGEDITVLKRDFLLLLKEWSTVFQADYYNKNIKMISLAVLFQVDKNRADEINNMLDNFGVSDWLFSILLDFLRGERTSDNKKLLFPKDYSTLQNVIYAESKVELIQKYLSKEWYNKDCGCYEAHKSAQKLYYGYWSFEAGAVVKILGLDDDVLRDVPYYPYDLVHYHI